MKIPSKYEFSIPLMVKLLESHEGHSITSQDSHKEKLITPDQQTENRKNKYRTLRSYKNLQIQRTDNHYI